MVANPTDSEYFQRDLFRLLYIVFILHYFVYFLFYLFNISDSALFEECILCSKIQK